MKLSHWFGKAMVGTRWLAVAVSLTVLCLGGAAFANTTAKPKPSAAPAKTVEAAPVATATAKVKPVRRAPVIDWSKTVGLPQPIKIGKVKSAPAGLNRDARFIGAAGQPLVLLGITGAIAAGVGLSGSRSSTAVTGIPNECAVFAGTYAMSMVSVTGPNAAVSAHIQDQFAGSIVALNASGTVSGGFLAGTWTCDQPDTDALSIAAVHSLVPLSPPPVDYEFVPNSPVSLDSFDATPLGVPITFTATGTIDVIALIDDDNNPATPHVVDPGASGTYSITAVTFTKQ